MKAEKLLAKHTDLLVKVLKFSPDLWHAAVVAAYAREKKCKVVKDHKDWLKLAAKGKRSIECDDMTITLAQAKKYFPEVFYPCEDEDDLIRKVIMASAHGQLRHASEARMRGLKKPAGIK